MVVPGDKVVLVGIVRAIDGTDALIVFGDESNHALRAVEADVIDVTTLGGGGGATDHGALTGLGDNDHPQYPLANAGAFTALAPTSAVAASASTELVRKSEADAIQADADAGIADAAAAKVVADAAQADADTNASAITGKQPLDGALTAFVALAPGAGDMLVGNGFSAYNLERSSAYGRGLLSLANAAALLAEAGAQASDADLTAIAALATTAYGRSLLTLADQAALLAAAGAQAADDTLTALAALTPTADQMVYATGDDVLAVTAITALGRAIVADATEADVRETVGMGVERGSIFSHFHGAEGFREIGMSIASAGSGASSGQGWEYITTGSDWSGCHRVETGTTATGFASIHTWNNVLLFNNGLAYSLECRINTEVESSVAQEFSVDFGFENDNQDAGRGPDETKFRQDRLTYGDSNWRCVTRRNSGTETVTDTGVAPTFGFTSNGQVLKIVVDLDAAEVRFYIDGALEATHTTNLMTNNDKTGFSLKIEKTAGTTEVGAGMDWLRMAWSPTDDLD